MLVKLAHLSSFAFRPILQTSLEPVGCFNLSLSAFFRGPLSLFEMLSPSLRFA